MVLNFYDLTWKLNEMACPCDVQFNEYIRNEQLANSAIFHFGTGEHHVVGVTNSKSEQPNFIFGITASKLEYQAYMDLVSSDAKLAITYKVLYADVYTLNSLLLPNFDLVTLFHVGEYWIGSGHGMHGQRSSEAPLDDKGLINLFLDKLNPGGKIVFYRNSAGWDRIEPTLSHKVENGEIKEVEKYKTLRFFASTKKRAPG